MKKTNHTQAFTLIELLIFMALFSIIIFLLTDLFSATLQVKTESEATSAVQEDGSYILSRLMYDIPRASAVSIPASLGATGQSLQITIDGINYSYGLSGGNLTITNNYGTNVLNSTETTVSSVSFKRLGNGNGKDTIQIQFTVTSTAIRNSGAESRSLQTTVGLR